MTRRAVYAYARGRARIVALMLEGIAVCAPVHDAFLIVAPLNRLEEDTARMQSIMERAGAAVTGGHTVFTDSKVVTHPNRYEDDRGREMWETVQSLIVGEDRPSAPQLSLAKLARAFD